MTSREALRSSSGESYTSDSARPMNSTGTYQRFEIFAGEAGIETSRPLIDASAWFCERTTVLPL
jgi:hypothetical protein